MKERKKKKQKKEAKIEHPFTAQTQLGAVNITHL